MLRPRAGGRATRPRRPGVALLLSVCPGLGQHYAGFLTRGVLLYISLIVASWLAAIVFMSVESRLGIVFLSVPFLGMAAIAIDAYACARRQSPDYHLQWFNRTWIYTVVFLTLLVTINPLMDFLVGRQIVRAFFMNSSSMEPTILERDVVLVNKMAFPKRGEIALIRLGRSRPSAKLTEVIDDQIVKRVVAVPGDTLEVKGGRVWIDSREVDEPYANFQGVLRFNNAQASNFGPRLVPADCYFVMGDNRNESIDSRIIGFIRAEQIGGTVTKLFWSWNFDEGGIRWSRTAKSLR